MRANRHSAGWLCGVVSGALLVWGGLPAEAQSLAKGRVNARVVCKDDARQSYALYLPSEYSAEKEWPILYAFDAGARGKLPVELFREGAERFGVIVAGSNNSRNGPWAPIEKAIKAMWKDTHARLSIDDRQVMATGFSGGARVASDVGFRYTPKVFGVIGCSATFSPRRRPDKDLPFAFYGIAGTSDMNRGEVERMDETLRKLGVSHRAAIFEGGHKWPPKAVCMRALEWMVLQAMKRELRQKDAAFVRKVQYRETAEAKRHEAAGEAYQAYRCLLDAEADLAGLTDTAGISARVAELAGRADVKAGMRKEKEKKARAEAAAKRLRERVAALRKELADPDKRDAAIERLVAQAREGTGSEDGRLAQSLLMQVFMGANVRGMQFLKQKDYAAAIEQLQIAAKISTQRGTVSYNLACAYSLNGRTEEALKCLDQAVAQGFTDKAHIDGDPDLANIRDTQRYRDILQGIGTTGR